MITNLSTVDDPIRTRSDILPGDPRNGAWSLQRLFEDMAPTPEAAPDMVEAILSDFDAPQVINTFTVAPRPGMRAEVLAHWPRTPDGKLDLGNAPLHLQAIVNRFDLRNLANGDGGEGRFVFAFYRTDGSPFQATLILEYKLPATTEDDVLGWAKSFHALGSLPFGESYNAACKRSPIGLRGAAHVPAVPTAARSIRCAPTRSTSATTASGSCASSTCRRPRASSSDCRST